MKIPAQYGDIEDFRPILEKEIVDITDEARRTQVQNFVIIQMESNRSSDTVASDVETGYERLLESESYRDEVAEDA